MDSVWSGSVEGAFFDSEWFDRNREILKPETKASVIGTKGRSFYCLGVDVGRLKCTTEVVVIKCVWNPSRNCYIKNIVNIYSFEEEHFGMQSIQIKRLFETFECEAAVVDGNGLGVGLIDFLVMDQEDPDTGKILPNLGVVNDEDGTYRKFRNENTVQNSLYIMKANSGINTELYTYLQTSLRLSRIKFLTDENFAKEQLEEKVKSGKGIEAKWSARRRTLYLQPFVETSVLREQLMNLIEDEGRSGEQNILLKQVSQRIKKDKVSALIYGLYWPKMKEDKTKDKKGIDVKDLMFFTPRSK